MAALRKTLGRGCTVLVLIGFIGVGAAIIALGIYSRTDPSASPGSDTALIIFGSLFALVAFGMLLLAILPSKRGRHTKKQRQTHPDEPWLWREDWTSRRIQSGSPAGVIIFTVFAIGFGGFGGIFVIGAVRTEEEFSLLELLFASIFPLIGLAMFIGVLYTAARYFKYGRSTCQLETLPGVIGGWLRATAYSNIQLGPNDHVRIRLSCIRRHVTGSGDNRTTHRDLKWQETLTLPANAFSTGAALGSTAIPIAFYIPRDCQATTLENASDRILWQVDLNAEVPGIDLSASYEVPIFVTPDSTDTPPPEAQEMYRVTQEDVADFAAASKIQINQAAGGGTEIYAPPRRTLGPALFISLFALIFSAATLFLLANLQLLMGVIFGAFSALMIWIALDMLFGWTRTTLRSDTIETQHKMLGLGKLHTLPKAAIEDVRISIGMQSGDSAYYRVELTTAGRKKHKIVGGLRDKNEARWIESIVETYLETE